MDDGSRKRKGPASKRLSPTLARIAERALVATPDQIREHQPTELDIKIAEAMMAGFVLQKEIAEECDCSAVHVGRRLKDSVACAWISNAVHAQISHRLGMVDAAMMNRAVNGNVQAAKLLYDRYQQMVSRQEVTHKHEVQFDPSQLTDDELQTMVDTSLARKAKTVEVEVVADNPDDRAVEGSETRPPGGSPRALGGPEAVD